MLKCIERPPFRSAAIQTKEGKMNTSDKTLADKLIEDKRILRPAVPCDGEEILGIYAYYVKNTAASFEYDVPSLAEFTRRIEKTLEKYPYIVAVNGNEVVGYAYTGAFKERAAYDWAVETSIYVRQDMRSMGTGRKLYTALESLSRAQNILNMNACIAYPAAEDEYLTDGSVKFHEKLGYRRAGRFAKCGYKFGRWYDMVWMEKLIGYHTPNPDEVIPFPRLGLKVMGECGLTLKNENEEGLA